jgi:hypothetical protein
MHDDAERDVATDPQTKRKNDPFSHHRNDPPYVIEGDK